MEWIEWFSTSRIADRKDGAFPMGWIRRSLARPSRLFPQKLYDRRRVRRSTDLESRNLFLAHVIAHLRRQYFSLRGTFDNIGCHMTTEMIHVRACARTESGPCLLSSFLSSENAKYSQYVWLRCKQSAITDCNNRSANYRWKVKLKGRIMFRLEVISTSPYLHLPI